MAYHIASFGCALVVALGASAAAAEPMRLDAAALDRVVAGIAVTGIEVTARTGPDSDNFSRSTAGLTFGSDRRSAVAGAQTTCTDDCSFVSLQFTSFSENTRLRNLLANFGIDVPDAGDADYVAVALADGGFNELEAGAFSPTGEAVAKGKVVPLVQEPGISATLGYGVGTTSGDGTVGMTGVVEQGQGVGTGAAIRTPLGRTVLLGVAVAVDPGALVPNTN